MKFTSFIAAAILAFIPIAPTFAAPVTARNVNLTEIVQQEIAPIPFSVAENGIIVPGLVGTPTETTNTGLPFDSHLDKIEDFPHIEATSTGAHPRYGNKPMKRPLIAEMTVDSEIGMPHTKKAKPIEGLHRFGDYPTSPLYHPWGHGGHGPVVNPGRFPRPISTPTSTVTYSNRTGGPLIDYGPRPPMETGSVIISPLYHSVGPPSSDKLQSHENQAEGGIWQNIASTGITAVANAPAFLAGTAGNAAIAEHEPEIEEWLHRHRKPQHKPSSTLTAASLINSTSVQDNTNEVEAQPSTLSRRRLNSPDKIDIADNDSVDDAPFFRIPSTNTTVSYESVEHFLEKLENMKHTLQANSSTKNETADKIMESILAASYILNQALTGKHTNEQKHKPETETATNIEDTEIEKRHVKVTNWNSTSARNATNADKQLRKCQKNPFIWGAPRCELWRAEQAALRALHEKARKQSMEALQEASIKNFCNKHPEYPDCKIVNLGKRQMPLYDYLGHLARENRMRAEDIKARLGPKVDKKAIQDLCAKRADIPDCPLVNEYVKKKNG